ncbi:MAG: NAD-dependent epimerase/dehydratase family protein [Gammaproteobacteria bacterium]|nr:NAD-dependent epimerase/dehydratase family protein [Gammaproteobacteria bacterium]
MKLLVTGVAGFIGAGVAMQALARGDEVVGIDNLNDYYDVSLKRARLARLERWDNFTFERADVSDRQAMAAFYARVKPQRVVHLAAQAGVRYSIDNPMAYVDANLVGFATVLEGARRHQVEHLVYASSSSVYGANTKLPFTESDSVDHPVSLYAATKKANELMAHSYSHLYGVPTTGLRFFTVYGPWGRPDMALFTFTRKILAGQAIDVFNHGKHHRDFTYIDDIVEGVLRVVDRAPAGSPKAHGTGEGGAPWRVYNIGNSQSVELGHYIRTLEHCLGREAQKNYLPMQPGDVPDTGADVSALEQEFAYRPNTSVQEGIGRFVDWYCDYYKVAL